MLDVVNFWPIGNELTDSKTIKDVTALPKFETRDDGRNRNVNWRGVRINKIKKCSLLDLNYSLSWSQNPFSGLLSAFSICLDETGAVAHLRGTQLLSPSKYCESCISPCIEGCLSAKVWDLMNIFMRPVVETFEVLGQTFYLPYDMNILNVFSNPFLSKTKSSVGCSVTHTAFRVPPPTASPQVSPLCMTPIVVSVMPS